MKVGGGGWGLMEVGGDGWIEAVRVGWRWVKVDAGG